MHKSNGRLVLAIGFALACALGPVTEALAQQQQPVRPPARVRVHPERLPPNAVRQCKFWLAPETRPSGTVIVPREVCWWERG